MRQEPLPPWFVSALGGLVIEVFVLIALGGAVRTMDAGLACPDWPLCFGQYIPDYHPQVYLEFIHRAMAGLVALTTAVLAIVLWRTSLVAKGLKAVMGAAVLLLIAQVVFGGLTVLWQLHAGVVAIHLAMGTAFFALLLWTYLSLTRGAEAVVKSPGLGAWSFILLIVLFTQVVLGGLVASNYAGLACPDFPTCQGEWIPTLSGPAGIHVLHRLNGYVLAVLVIFNWIFSRDSGPRAKGLATGLLAMTITQIAIGAANVLLQIPALVSVLHLATATALVSLAVRQAYMYTQGRNLVA